MSQNTEHHVRQLQRRIQLTLFLRYSLLVTATWLFTMGAVVFTLRYFQAWSAQGYYLTLTLLPLLVVAWGRSVQSIPDKVHVRAWLDQHYGWGGLLLASVERDTAGWAAKEIPQPKVERNFQVEWGRLVASMAFMVLALMVPYQWVRGNVTQPMDIEDELSRVADKIETLEEQGLLEEKETKAMQAEMARLRQDADGDDPGKTWEALDHLEQSLGRKAEEAADSMEATQALANNLEQLAEALENNPNGVDQKTLKQAMQELSKLAADAAAENELMKEAMKAMGMDPNSLNSPNGMSAADLGKLQAAMQMSQKQLQAAMAKMDNAKMLKHDNLNKGKKKKDSQGLSDFLARQGNQCKSLTQCAGKGSRGSGENPAEMTWKDPSADELKDFQPIRLTPGDLEAMRKSIQLAETSAVPERGEDDQARHNALAGTRAGSGSAHTQTLLPRHRAAVKRYFDKSGNQ